MDEQKQISAIDRMLNGAKKIGLYVAVGMAAMQAVLFFVNELGKLKNNQSNEPGNN